MFVTDNFVSSVKRYFYERLKDDFSHREIRQMFLMSLQKRLNLSDSELLLADNFRTSESDLLFFRSIVQRLLSGEPFQYIHGETLFYNLPIKIDRRSLIPRPETEELVHWIYQTHREEFLTEQLTILDIGTGSGCIALALKKNTPQSSVYGFDISEQALLLARENAKLLDLNVHFDKIDILTEQLPFSNQSVDIIVSNPPYVLRSEQTEMQDCVLNYEPHTALFVEDDQALSFYEAIVGQAKKILKENGSIYFEINEKYGHQNIELFQKHAFSNIQLKQDLQGKNRMLSAQPQRLTK